VITSLAFKPDEIYIRVNLEGLTSQSIPTQTVTVTSLDPPNQISSEIGFRGEDIRISFSEDKHPEYLYIRGPKWLTKRILVEKCPNKLTLIGGDCNGDNRIDWDDVDILALAFYSTPKDSNWDSRADLDCNEHIDDFDADILFRNWWKTGD
jgi:hypothetical protein